MTEVEKAEKNLREAARLFDKSPAPDAMGRFSDLFLKHAAIEYVRELVCHRLGYDFGDRDFDGLFDELLALSKELDER